MTIVPDPGHPLYYAVDSAILELYFYADSDDDAVARAKAFPACARWTFREIERLGRVRIDPPQSDLVCAGLVAEAQEVGIALRMIPVAVGGDPECQPRENKDPEGIE
jgi:hypothetical protein